jgi:type I restriction-modification system DNA methylase subunit
MASLLKTYRQEKILGQVYTPNFVVCKILDDMGYTGPGVLGKPIVDPACGDGRFLMEIVKRIIRFSPEEVLKSNLECIYGWDIDETAIATCITHLNALIHDRNICIQWNISVTNAINKHEKSDLFSTNNTPNFDFIVGNPPYIRIQHLDIAQRQYIQQNYQFCKSGSTDIYIAFYELCLNLLSEEGVCGLITPNTFFFTETGRSLRQYFS